MGSLVVLTQSWGLQKKMCIFPTRKCAVTTYVALVHTTSLATRCVGTGAALTQRMDLGPCPHSHLPRYKELYEAALERGEQYPQIVNDFRRNMHAFVTDIDRKITANKRRLQQTPEEMERFNVVMRDINEVREAITAAQTEMEALGEQGRVDESVKELAKVEALQAELRDKERELQTLQENSGASGHQKLRVCDVCGAYLSMLDSDRRLADHFSGKMHIGYMRLRELLVEFEQQKRAEQKEPREWRESSATAEPRCDARDTRRSRSPSAAPKS